MDKKLYRKQYYEKNRDKILARQRKYYQDNKEKIAERRKNNNKRYVGKPLSVNGKNITSHNT